MYLLHHAGVSRGLKEYTAFVNSKEAAGFQEVQDVTQKPRTTNTFVQPNLQLDAKSNYKSETSKHIPEIGGGQLVKSTSMQKEEEELGVRQAGQEMEVEMMDEEEEDEENKKKEFELIIHQYDGPQTSFFSVKEEGAKIGRHSSNQILILDESISRYHAEIKF